MSGGLLHQSHTLVALKQPHTVDFNDVSCLLMVHQFWMQPFWLKSFVLFVRVFTVLFVLL